MNVSRLQYNDKQAEVKVFAVYRLVVYTKHQSVRGLADLTRYLGVTEICFCA